MNIEVMFPEVCNLYGDLANVKLIKDSYPETVVIETGLKDIPYFFENKPDLIYMGSVTEDNQVLVIEALMKYKGRIKTLIDEGVCFLVTGNAIEVFGGEISDVDGTKLRGLGIVEISTKRDMFNRFNSLYIGKFDNLDIVGYKSQFTHSYYYNNQNSSQLFDTIRGAGLNPEVKEEGIRINNFFATYVIGPLLILNPDFAKYLLEQLGINNPKLLHEKDMIEAYKLRVKEYSDSNTGFYY
ncbi:MAG: hypothetical protein JJE03_04785 [Peptostreptococcaceae bacterium]|nr:hypothetical protein [Peptostreptococcaceae bacterium]